MTTHSVKIFNATTGEVIERDLTALELKQVAIDAETSKQRWADLAQAEAAKAAAQAKLAALGLTTDDLAALGL